ncbi:hypothetical protein SB30_280039 [Klebsiella quasipneumoniae subsp. similipneumoniae]|nr:hypothetical protein SB30_280039 [Klebsiella quasipneumoniae subsp. similipneumoniae]
MFITVTNCLDFIASNCLRNDNIAVLMHLRNHIHIFLSTKGVPPRTKLNGFFFLRDFFFKSDAQLLEFFKEVREGAMNVFIPVQAISLLTTQ